MVQPLKAQSFILLKKTTLIHLHLSLYVSSLTLTFTRYESKNNGVKNISI